MSIKDQCKAVLSDGKPRTISELSREVAERFERGYKVVSATIYQDLLKDPGFIVSAGRPKQMSLKTAA